MLVTVDQSGDRGFIRLQGLDNDIVFVVEQLNNYLKEVQRINAKSEHKTRVSYEGPATETFPPDIV